MFFRRKVKSVQAPILGDDGFYYIEDGMDYNSDEYETDSDDYDSGEEHVNNESDEKEGEEEEEHNQSLSGLGASSEVQLEPDGREFISQDEQLLVMMKEENQSESVLRRDFDVVSESHDKSEDEQAIHAGEAPSNTIEDMNTTMLEKRSLVYLAAQHDRVDIVKAILQPTNQNNDDIISIILNNQVVNINTDDNQSSVENGTRSVQNIFLPPLHVAIASLSVNVATCLLRMGANPSIRPNIPQDWKGPEGCIDEHGNPTFEKVDLKSLYDGKSAWELAFPIVHESDPPSMSSSKSWFSSWTSNASISKNNGSLKYSTGSSGLDGIKHAFTAEILRAIGSDEVNRLQEILNSGIDSDFTIAGKEIVIWCDELGAVNCSTYLHSRLDNHKEKSSDAIVASTNSPDAALRSSVSSLSSVEDDIVFDENTLQLVLNRIEETESLNHALSIMRDNMADELSITEGLLMQHEGQSNDALISHVRMLKQKRAELDDEIMEWEDRIQKISLEFDVTMTEVKRIGCLTDKEVEAFGSAFHSFPNPMRNLSPEEMESRIKAASRHLNQSHKKAKMLRENIAELAVQTSRNLERVEALGLQGAVRLTRKLKEEMSEQETVIKAAKMRASDLTHQLQFLRQNIDRRNNARMEASVNASEDVSQVLVESNVVNAGSESESNDITRKTLGLESSENEPDETLTTIDMITQEHADLSSLEDDIAEKRSSSVEEGSREESSEESFEVVPGRISNTNAIRQGLSTDLTSREAREHFFATRVWDLIKRIIGLGKAAAQSAVDDVVNLPRVLII